jgi:hypothetical protein
MVSAAGVSLLGTPFYLIEMIEGRIFWDTILPGLSRQDRALISCDE